MDDFQRGDRTGLIHLYFLHGGLIQPGVVAEFGNGLLLAVVRFQHLWPLRPGVIFCPCSRGLPHHFQLRDGQAALADGGSHTVIAGITAAHNHHVLSLRCDGEAFCLPNYLFGSCCQKIHCKVNALGICAGHVEAAGCFGAAAEDNRVKLLLQLLRGNIHTHIGVDPERYPLRLHELHPAGDHALVQLHIGDAVHQQAAGAVFPLEHRDAVPPVVQLVCHRQPGGAGADNRHLFAAAHRRNPGRNPALLEAHLDDGQLVVIHRDTVTHHPAGAGRLAKRGTDPPRKFREIVGFGQPGKSFLPVAVVYLVVPLGNQVVQRAAAEHPAENRPGLAEGYTAVHAPGGLPLPLRQAERRMKFRKGRDSLQRFHRSVHLSVIFQKSGWLSHTHASLLTR